MIDIIKRIVNKKIKEIYNNFLEQTLMLSFGDGCILKLYGCAIVFDLGIIGQTVSYASCDGTLGMVLELKKMNLDPDDYNFLLLSRDIKDYENKNEIVISYKNFEFENF